jgi:hypothetical protein
MHLENSSSLNKPKYNCNYSNNQEDVDYSASAISNISYQPQNDQNYGNDI